MDKLKWISSAGGPLILISDMALKFWSGILKRNSYLNGIIEEADDFLNEEEADYGKACLVEGYLGVVDVENDTALVLGDQPMLTTSFTLDNKIIIARWFYGENEEFVDNELMNLDLNLINNWEFALNFFTLTDKQYLFDSACYLNMLEKEGEDYLLLNIKAGKYKIWTSIYEPDEKTKLILHKLDAET